MVTNHEEQFCSHFREVYWLAERRSTWERWHAMDTLGGLTGYTIPSRIHDHQQVLDPACMPKHCFWFPNHNLHVEHLKLHRKPCSNCDALRRNRNHYCLSFLHTHPRSSLFVSRTALRAGCHHVCESFLRQLFA